MTYEGWPRFLNGRFSQNQIEWGIHSKEKAAIKGIKALFDIVQNNATSLNKILNFIFVKTKILVNEVWSFLSNDFKVVSNSTQVWYSDER